jgi:hypothetical protein
MGVNCGNLVLLAEYARRARLGSVLTFGRLFNVLSAKDRRKIMRTHGIPESVLAARQSEGLFAALGADQVTSLDIAGPDCDVRADLTDDFASTEAMRPYLGRFDAIIDYGTSEHVFNFTQALVNTYNLLADDGVYIFDLPTSGWLSHCLYQFTPSYFLSVGASPYFDLTYCFFHRKRGDRIYRITHYNNISYFRINGWQRVSAWGVLRKVRPEGEERPLALDRFRVMQLDPRDGNQPRKLSLIGKLRSCQRYSAATIHKAFE